MFTQSLAFLLSVVDCLCARYVGVALLQGGSVTITAFLRTLICCLATHPEAQRRAHEDIDRAIGSSRTPTLEDIEHLPYVQAVIKEVSNNLFRCESQILNTSGPPLLSVGTLRVTSLLLIGRDCK